MKLKLLVVSILLGVLACSPAYSDYALPIAYEDYTPSGTWTTDFEFAPALVSAIASARNISTEKIHSFADIALAGTWTTRPMDIRNLSQWGQYGTVTFPITESHAGDDYYVVRCTLGDDINAGERLEFWGFVVDASTRETVYSEDYVYSGSDGVFFDEEFNRTYKVPDSKIIYAAVKLNPDNINTGVLTVIRGEYIEEDDPTERLDSTLTEIIARDMGIDVKDLKYVTEENLFAPREATPEMNAYVKSDDHEIIGGIVTVSTDIEGWHYFKVTLPDDVWEEVKSKDVKDFKFYGLADTEEVSGQFKASFILGLINTYEIYTLTGTKMKTFGVKEFLMVGLLNSGQPFTLFVAKTLLAILTGGLGAGCNSGFFVSAAALGIIIVKFIRKH